MMPGSAQLARDMAIMALPIISPTFIAAVVTREPDWSALPPDTLAPIRPTRLPM
jgi:hypothetical protein